MSNEEQILICAVRYALGRQSYITGVVADYVAHKRRKLSEQCKAIIVRDIQEEYDFYHRQGQTLGMECDERSWLRLLKLLEGGADNG